MAADIGDRVVPLILTLRIRGSHGAGLRLRRSRGPIEPALLPEHCRGLLSPRQGVGKIKALGEGVGFLAPATPQSDPAPQNSH